MSFRRFVESSPPGERVLLLTDDAHLRNVLPKELRKLQEHVYLFHVFLKCLHVLVADLPRCPLGKQLREVYSLAVSKDVTQTQGYRESFQLLGFQSKDELSLKVARVEELLLGEVRKRSNEYRKSLEKFHAELGVYVNNLKTVGMDDEEEMEVEDHQEEGLFAGCKDRTKLRNVSITEAACKKFIVVF